MWRSFGIATCLVVACSGPPPRSASSTVSTEPEPALPLPLAEGNLTVVSYNVNFGLAGDQAIIELIRELDADVVFLQETHRGWERALRAELAEQFPHMAFRHHRVRPGGLAVLSRLPIDDGGEIGETAGVFPAWRVVVDSDLGRVQFLNVHLYPPVLQSATGWWRAYFESQKIHRKEIEAFAQSLDDDLPVVVLGDFNEDAGGPAVKWLQDRGLSLALSERGPTWRWETRLGTIWELDHMLHGPRLRTVSANVVKGGSSDHFPIVATFARAE